MTTFSGSQYDNRPGNHAQTPPRNASRRLSQEEINRMSPEEINQAVAGNPPIQREMDPKTVGDVIRKDGYSFPANAQVLKEAGVVPVWNLTTGYPTVVLKNLLPVKLSEYNELGQKVFSLYQGDVPEGLPHQNAFPCMLHEGHEIRPLAQKLGYGTCPKMLRTQYDVLTHTKNRHRGAWDSFDRDKIEGEKAEEREYRRTSMAAITAAALATKPAEQIEKACVGCGESVFALNDESVDVKLNVHMRACTPYTETFGAPEPLTASTFTGGISVSELAIGPFTPEEDLKDLPLDTEWLGANTPTETDPADSVQPVTSLATEVQPGQTESRFEMDKSRMAGEFAQNCTECDVVTDGKSKTGALSRMRAHVKKEHPDAD